MKRITIDPKIMTGKPCIRDTRIPVLVILKLLAMRENWGQILDDYSNLKNEDIIASLEYAVESVSYLLI